MRDYTPEGVRQNQIDNMLYYQQSINNRLKKVNRYLFLLTMVGLTTVAFKFKALKELIDTKGE